MAFKKVKQSVEYKMTVFRQEEFSTTERIFVFILGLVFGWAMYTGWRDGQYALVIGSLSTLGYMTAFTAMKIVNILTR